MNKKEFNETKIGDVVKDELTLTISRVIDKDKNGFVLDDGVYHCGDSLKRFSKEDKL